MTTITRKIGPIHWVQQLVYFVQHAGNTGGHVLLVKCQAARNNTTGLAVPIPNLGDRCGQHHFPTALPTRKSPGPVATIKCCDNFKRNSAG